MITSLSDVVSSLVEKAVGARKTSLFISKDGSIVVKPAHIGRSSVVVDVLKMSGSWEKTPGTAIMSKVAFLEHFARKK